MPQVAVPVAIPWPWAAPVQPQLPASQALQPRLAVLQPTHAAGSLAATELPLGGQQARPASAPAKRQPAQPAARPVPGCGVELAAADCQPLPLSVNLCSPRKAAAQPSRDRVLQHRLREAPSAHSRHRWASVWRVLLPLSGCLAQIKTWGGCACSSPAGRHQAMVRSALAASQPGRGAAGKASFCCPGCLEPFLRVSCTPAFNDKVPCMPAQVANLHWHPLRRWRQPAPPSAGRSRQARPGGRLHSLRWQLVGLGVATAPASLQQ